MKKINLIISCSNKKIDGETKAGKIYDGTWWKVLKNNRQGKDFNLFILSAKYGLIHEDTEIENYNLRFTSKKKPGVNEVSIDSMIEKVKNQVNDYNLKEVYFLGGKDYRKIIKETDLEVSFIGNDSDGIGEKARHLKNFLKNL